MTDQQGPAAALQVAMRYLARREYSACELRLKLASKNFEESVIEVVLADLTELNLQSDERYAEVYVRSKIGRGIGRFRIERELEQKGVSLSLIDDAMDESDCDWFNLALHTYRKKYKTSSDLDFREKARRFRYMTARGFDHEQINYAIDVAVNESDSD